MSAVERKERPIIFSGPMVRAILEGRKTQTRRGVKWEPRTSGLPKTHLHDFDRAFVDPGLGGGQYLKVPFAHPKDGWDPDPKNDTIDRCYCPYGEIGDRLWVKESWCPFIRSCDSGIRYRAGGQDKNIVTEYEKLADLARRTGCDLQYSYGPNGNPNLNEVVRRDGWRSPIHMPRWASRITLEITGIRVERLQDISDDEIIAELGEFRSMSYPRQRKNDFRKLWESINGDNSWEANPWVWVVEFKKVV